MDERKCVNLLLIDLSAAFDTIYHAILLNTLRNTIGVKDRCLSRIAAYLQHRQYTVLIAGEQSIETTQVDARCHTRVTVVHYLFDPSYITT